MVAATVTGHYTHGVVVVSSCRCSAQADKLANDVGIVLHLIGLVALLSSVMLVVV